MLVVTDDDVDSQRLEDALDRVRDDLAWFTGNTPQLIAMTRSQLRRMVEADDPLVESWERDARTISGPDVRGLIREERRWHLARPPCGFGRRTMPRPFAC